MRVGEILDKSTGGTKEIFRSLFPLILLSVALTVAYYLLHRESVVLAMMASLGSILVTVLMRVRSIMLSSNFWRPGSISATQLSERLRPMSIVRFIILDIRAGIIAGLGFLLFVIPGLIYWINRVLMEQAFLIEGQNIAGSLRRSKHLMTRERWYKLSGPQIRIAGVMIVLTILGMLVGLSALFGIRVIGTYTRAQDVSEVIVGIVTGLFNALITIYYSVAITGFYWDLRDRYEGADLFERLENLERIEEHT